uniref:Uncharacterized protein n=1 Tax=Rhizophora mucronata TaxID=61149 RepID=A0A2P2PUG0_RHIMU
MQSMQKHKPNICTCLSPDTNLSSHKFVTSANIERWLKWIMSQSKYNTIVLMPMKSSINS